MNVNIEGAIKAWEQATDRDVIQAVTIDKNGYPPEIQTVIEGEIERRGLHNEVELEMAKLPKKLSKRNREFNVADPHTRVTKRKTARLVVGGVLVFFGIVLASIIVWDILEGKSTITEAIFFPPNLGWMVSLIIGVLWYNRLGKMELRGPLALSIGIVFS